MNLPREQLSDSEVIQIYVEVFGGLPPIQRAWFLEQFELKYELRVSLLNSSPAPNCVFLPPEAA